VKLKCTPPFVKALVEAEVAYSSIPVVPVPVELTASPVPEVRALAMIVCTEPVVAADDSNKPVPAVDESLIWTPTPV
jgi:hypothetical protein